MKRVHVNAKVLYAHGGEGETAFEREFAENDQIAIAPWGPVGAAFRLPVLPAQPGCKKLVHVSLG